MVSCDWTNIWSRHIETYLNSPPRCGYWLASLFPSNISVLEIAAGSCRDCRYLFTIGFDARGCDFDQKTIEYLLTKYPLSMPPLFCEDAFAFSFEDDIVDLSFSNGFWILFNDNEKIKSLLHEQARITRKYIITIVHNADNKKLIDSFFLKAKSDPLYDIRFFSKNELLSIISDSDIHFRTIKLNKFGGKVDILLNKKIKGYFNPINPIAKYIVPRLYKYQSWKYTERIACIIELE